jgi:hypothetical protein
MEPSPDTQEMTAPPLGARGVGVWTASAVRYNSTDADGVEEGTTFWDDLKVFTDRRPRPAGHEGGSHPAGAQVSSTSPRPRGLASPARAPPDAAAAALQRQVDAAIAGSKQSLHIAGGAYHFGLNNFQIVGARKLALLAPAPITLWFIAGAGVNITDSEELSLGNWTIDYENGGNGVGMAGHVDDSAVHGAITFNLLNSTGVRVVGLTIRRAKFMVVTAFNGGGAVRGHRPSTLTPPPCQCHLTSAHVRVVVHTALLRAAGLRGDAWAALPRRAALQRPTGRADHCRLGGRLHRG